MSRKPRRDVSREDRVTAEPRTHQELASLFECTPSSSSGATGRGISGISTRKGLGGKLGGWEIQGCACKECLQHKGCCYMTAPWKESKPPP